MERLSPQETIIVEILRDQKAHCGREWLNRIKDDRRRITSLNRGYMKSKGYVIKGYPCDGRCGRAKCPLYMRRAEKLKTEVDVHQTIFPPQKKLSNSEMLNFFDSYVKA